MNDPTTRHQTVNVRAVDSMVDAMTLTELLNHLTPPWLTSGPLCPNCSTLADEVGAWVDGLTWKCGGRPVDDGYKVIGRTRCAGGTVFEIKRRVLESADALTRLFEEVHANAA